MRVKDEKSLEKYNQLKSDLQIWELIYLNLYNRPSWSVRVTFVFRLLTSEESLRYLTSKDSLETWSIIGTCGSSHRLMFKLSRSLIQELFLTTDVFAIEEKAWQGWLNKTMINSIDKIFTKSNRIPKCEVGFKNIHKYYDLSG